MKLVAHHGDRYFLFAIEWGDEGDPWAPYGRVYDRTAGVMFTPIPFRRLNEAEDFFEEWQGPDEKRQLIEEEASVALR
jgi:hypothetical protein